MSTENSNEIKEKDIIEEIKKLNKKYQKKFNSKNTITRDFYRENSKHGYSYTKYFGTFKELLSSSELSKSKCTKEDLIKEIIELDKAYKKEFGKLNTINKHYYCKHTTYGDEYRVLFGKYSTLLKESGLKDGKGLTIDIDTLKKETIELDTKYKKRHGRHKKISASYLYRHTSFPALRKYLESKYNAFEDFLDDMGIDCGEDPKNYIRSKISIVKKQKNPKKKRYFITAYMPESEVNYKAMDAIENYCNQTNSELVIGLMIGVKKYIPYDIEDPFYVKYKNNFATEYTFNSNIKMKDFTQHPQLVDPFKSIGELMHVEGSFIIPHTKQNLKVEAVSVVKFPHVGFSTGAISTPNYTADQTGSKALNMQIYGGLILETEDDETYFVRQVQFDTDGSFIDLGVKYSPTKVEDEFPIAVTLGDSHFGAEDLECEKVWMDVIDQTKVSDYIIMHDIFDGKSISHHDEVDIAKLANKPEHLSTLEKELQYCKDKLELWLNTFPNKKIVIVRSNHDEWVDKYIGRGKYVEDRINYRVAVKIAGYHLDGLNPIEEYLKRDLGLENSNLMFLKRNDHFPVAGIKNIHGDYGRNGSRGSMNTIGRVYGPTNSAHTHTPNINGFGWTVGTSCLLDAEYLKGASTWMQSLILTYGNGSRQMIINVNGKWRLK